MKDSNIDSEKEKKKEQKEDDNKTNEIKRRKLKNVCQQENQKVSRIYHFCSTPLLFS